MFFIIYWKLNYSILIFFADLGRNYKNYKETHEKGGREFGSFGKKLPQKTKVLR